MKLQPSEIERLYAIRYIIIDVDGTLTDSGIYYDEHGNELKKFSTRDAAGFFAANAAGIETIILTGRECAATTRRMRELKADYVYQDVKDKKIFLQSFMQENNISNEQVAYIGDDINDLSPMSLVGYVACPVDSCKEVIHIADYVSSKRGGEGVARDVIEYILTQRGDWNKAISNLYGVGI